MTENDDRIDKYKRVLPKLWLDRELFTTGAPIVVHVEQPLGERCDVLARLVNVETGRTYAQTELTLSDETPEIPLGKALNIPDGAYYVHLTPPLAQFHGGVPSESKLPCEVAASPVTDRPYGDAASRREEAIRAVAAQGGAMRGVAEAVLEDRPPPMEAIRELALGDAPSWVFVAAMALGELSPELKTILEDQSGGVLWTFERAVATHLSEGKAAEAVPLLQRMATHGFPEDLDGWPSLYCVLATIGVLDDGEAGQLATAVLDKAFVIPALHAVRGWSHRSDAALTRLGWGVGCFGLAGPAELALALAGYEVPSIIQAIALDESETTTVRVQPSDGESLPPRHLVCWRRGGCRLEIDDGSWTATLGIDAEISGAADVPFSVDLPPQVQYSRGALLARGGVINFPGWAFDQWRVDGDLLLAVAGSGYLAIRSNAPFEIGHMPDFLAPAASGLTVDAGDVCFCQLGYEERDGSFDDFVEKVRALDLDLTADPPRATTLNGDTLILDGTPPPPTDLHIDSPYVKQRFGEEVIDIRYGDHGLRLDFSV